MSLPGIANLVTQGIAAYNAGDRERAYALLTEVLHADPHNEAGWLWMSGVVQDPAERRYCLERVVAINPQHAAAQRGLAKLPADLVARSPLPAPKAAATDQACCAYPGCTHPVARPEHTFCYAHWKEQKQPKAAPPVELARCAYPGCTQPVARAGHTFCRPHWKETRQHATPKADAQTLLNAAQLGERCELSSQRINLLLAELGWIERKGPNWYPTVQGQALGAVKRHYNETGKAYVVWPEHVHFDSLVGGVFPTLKSTI